MDAAIEQIRFIPIKKRGDSQVGWISFNYGGMEVKDMAVHIRSDRKGYRVVYPKNKDVDRHIIRPIDKQTQEHIDSAVTAHVNML